MMNLATAVLILGVVASAGITFLVYWTLWWVGSTRLMRCPEVGAIAIVDAERVSHGEASGVTVRSCELWPEKKDCRRGCLVRYHETTPGCVNLRALRPFERV